PAEVLIGYVRKAAELRAAGEKLPRPKMKREPLAMPDDLGAALKNHTKAREVFDRFPPGHRREYIEWITEAKRPETREQRLATALEWIAEGKHRNWKHQRKPVS
ncbi:MAG: YdeI/OmpD-associated family protein, partial [Verrucomicrobiota bacterium]|nr:YdeI/OmpD-associated family protein [Verrucomicrobiota bacterium]